MKNTIVCENVMTKMDAMLFALGAHRSQRRKYTNEPYITHPLEVASIVAQYLTHYPVELHAVMLRVAVLHDVVEDCDVEVETLRLFFGDLVADGVLLLSDLAEGNREERNRQSRLRLSRAPGWVQTVKCADLISNTQSIAQHDPDYAVRYLAEKRALLEVMTGACIPIHERATKLARCRICDNSGYEIAARGYTKVCTCVKIKT